MNGFWNSFDSGAGFGLGFMLGCLVAFNAWALMTKVVTFAVLGSAE